MKRKNLISIAILLLALMAVDTALAMSPRQGRFQRGRWQKIRQSRQVQRMPFLGVEFGHNFYEENYLLGAQLDLPVGRFWSFVPSFHYSLTGDDDMYDRWQINGDLAFKPMPRGGLYFGGGVAMERWSPEDGSADTSYGPNAFVGMEMGGRSPMKSFVEARWTFMDETYFSVLGGIKLALR